MGISRHGDMLMSLLECLFLSEHSMRKTQTKQQVLLLETTEIRTIEICPVLIESYV